VEKEGNVLVLRRIRVRYRLQAAKDQWETARRVHGIHAPFCPMYLSVKAAIDVTTELELVEPDG